MILRDALNRVINLPRTRQLAAAANIQDVGSLRQLVIESKVVNNQLPSQI